MPEILTARGFESWLDQRIVSRTPAAVVRFGDGEALLLRANHAEASSITAANRYLARRAGRTYSPEAILDIRAALEYARDNAQVLGALGDAPFDAMLPAIDRRAAWMASLRSLRADGAEPRELPPALASCHLHHEVVSALPRLLRGRRVSAVSCRDVKPVIEKMWGVVDVAVYRLPSPHGERDVDGSYEAAMHAQAVWPDAHERVLSELEVREPGEVFLIGGGVFAKDVCVHVRERGGIGLDMGSALDYIAGKLARRPARTIFELHEKGLSAPEIVARLQEVVRVPLDPATIAQRIEAASPYLARPRDGGEGRP